MEVDSVSAVVDALERAPRIILPLVGEVPAAVLRRRPKSGRWSAHEHVCHLAKVHELFFARLDLMLANPFPAIKPYDPDVDEPGNALLAMDLEASLKAFERDRAKLVARIKTLAPADWARTAEHAEYSRYSVFIMFRHVALHDFLHAYRIEECLLSREWD